jgi:hypothetical protein
MDRRWPSWWQGRMAALMAVWRACFRDYHTILAPGEQGVVMVLAADRRQARVVFDYIAALIDAVPMLAGMVIRRTRESITLRNGVVVEVHTTSFRALRGYTILAVILDEIAFWRDESSANPDAASATTSPRLERRHTRRIEQWLTTHPNR